MQAEEKTESTEKRPGQVEACMSREASKVGRQNSTDRQVEDEELKLHQAKIICNSSFLNVSVRSQAFWEG